jgi:hypothetical protein
MERYIIPVSGAIGSTDDGPRTSRALQALFQRSVDLVDLRAIRNRRLRYYIEQSKSPTCAAQNRVHAPRQVTRQGVDAVTDPKGVDDVTDPKGVDDVTDPISEIGTTAAWETSCAAGEGTNATTRRAL